MAYFLVSLDECQAMRNFVESETAKLNIPPELVARASNLTCFTLESQGRECLNILDSSKIMYARQDLNNLHIPFSPVTWLSGNVVAY